MKNAILCLAGLWLALPLSAQNAADSSFFEMTLEQLLMAEVSVTSNEALTTREAPGIVTLLTEDEIRNSGATDLMHLLELVPGFSFGCDVEGITGLGMRGNWAHEGKILLLIDGIEMNELMYSTLQFGNHYPIDLIKRIEIIRGPGSALYGGNAEYAVINIVTINNKEFTGLTATASYGRMQDARSHRNFSFAAGERFGDLSLNIAGFLGQGNRSDQDYTDYWGNTTNLAGKQLLDPAFAQLALSWKGLTVRAMVDHYQTTTIDGFDVLLSQPYGLDFTSYAIDLRYKLQLNKRFSLTPRFCYRQQSPWIFAGGAVDNEFIPYDRTAIQPLFQLTGNYEMSDTVSVQAGAEYSSDQAMENIAGNSFADGSMEVMYNNTALFVQARCDNQIANITVGARYHNNCHYDASFVPRIGVTKVIGRFHTKLLYSKAFRAPGIENIDRGDNIQPENTTVAELEAGYQLGSIAFVSANAFDITTTDVIVYSYENGDAYANRGKTGTRGLELEMKFKGWLGYANINYAFYTTKGKPVVSNYAVPEQESVLLAFPAHRINVSGCFKITRLVSATASLTWSSTTYDFAGIDSMSQQNITRSYSSQVFANLYLSTQQFIAKGLSAGVGCRNMTNEDKRYIQPYNSSHAPLPGASREIYAKLTYTIH